MDELASSRKRLKEWVDKEVFRAFSCDICQKAKEILQSWLNLQGHSRCWWHPEVLQKLADLYGLKQTIPSNFPRESEARAGCERYRKEQYEREIKAIYGQSPNQFGIIGRQEQDIGLQQGSEYSFPDRYSS